MEGGKNLGTMLLTLNHGLPQTPGLTESNLKAYAYALKGIPLDAIDVAIKTLLQTWEKATIYPTPGTIRRLALEHLAKEQGIPSASAAWIEVRREIEGRGALRAQFSHPAIVDAVSAMGGALAISRSDNLAADRAHWYNTIYPQAIDKHTAIMAHQLELAAGTEIKSLPEATDD